MAKYDLLIAGGDVIDGTGAPRKRCDLAIKNGKIAKIAASINPSDAKEVMDATGLIVAPGVIDIHTHYDAQVRWDPYCTNSSWHGTTSVVVSNCGFGYAPCAPEARERYMMMMERTEELPIAAQKAVLPWDWESFPEWMESLKRVPKGVNMGCYLPLNALMVYVMGIDAAKSRSATQAEREKMRELLFEAMDHGALGLSLAHLHDTSGHVDFDGTPMPTDTMDISDAYYLAEALGERGEGVIQAIVQMPGAAQNQHVVEELARRSGRPVIHNLIIAVPALPDYHVGIMKWLDEMAAEGLEIYSQSVCARALQEFKVSTYTFWDGVNVVFREFSGSGGVKEKLEKAKSPEFREKLKAVYKADAMNGFGGPLSKFILVNAYGASEYSSYEGKPLQAIIDDRGGHEVDVMFDVFIATDGEADFSVAEATSDDPIVNAELIRHPRVIAGASDGGAHMKFFSGGQYSTDMIMWMVRENGLFTLEQIHEKLSGQPADIMGFKDRGRLLEGQCADIMIYDFSEISYCVERYEVRHDLPGGDWRRVSPAKGVRWVLVNGELIMTGMTDSGATPGTVLRNTPVRAGKKVAQQDAKVVEMAK